MRLPAFILAALLALASHGLQAQGFDEPARVRTAENPFSKLRGISYFFIDVVTVDPRPEDGDLRQELRDGIELEMRRAGITPKEYSGVNPEGSTPLLTIEIRFDRGLGRYSADVTISIRDNATIARNREPVLAQTYVQTKKAVGSSDATLTKEIKGRSRELVSELIEGMKKVK
ncbi:MAG: hypothetical protein RIR91_767 [Verrucomicrobiota bacterium]